VHILKAEQTNLILNDFVKSKDKNVFILTLQIGRCNGFDHPKLGAMFLAVSQNPRNMNIVNP